MRWVAIFQDPQDVADVRSQHRPRHLDYLREHTDEILIAGPLRDQPGGPIVGGLWVMEVQNRNRAVQLVEGDPYYQLLKRSYKLYTWDKALEDRSATL